MSAGWGCPGCWSAPTRGLLVFCPFLVFVAVGLAQRLRTPSSRRLAVALSVAVVAQVLLYSQADWRAGVTWGPRWLTDLLPIMIWMLAAAPLVLSARARGLLVVTMVAAVGMQAIGAFWYTHTSDERIFAAGNPASLNAAWDPRNTPFIVELEHPPAAFELQCNTRGSIDRPRPVLDDTGTVPKLQPGTAIQGWALACGGTPAQVILLVDGRIIGETSHFFVRPDVNRALHVSAASGWSVPADTGRLVPGRHVLQLAVRVSPRSDIRILREQPVMVTAPPSLNALAALAARRLREDQAGQGYWLTDYTSSPRYVAPQKEMNTYLTSILVDLLAPVAPKLGLADVMARAKRELAAQIESNGLVRYHGLPNAPTIGTLGCVITPDADDTALVWRTAGPGAGDPRLQRMLRTLARYRDGRGLYRTWLAPQNRYQCLDPGRDPDPADIAIQMHVYLMLRQFDRPAARGLCKAIRRWSGNDEVWVYYAKTALVPYLRSAELEQLGCTIPLPTARLARPVPGQEWWSEAARRLVQTGASGPGANARQPIRDLLARLGDDDFALLRRCSAIALPQRSDCEREAVLLVQGRRLRTVASALRGRQAGRPMSIVAPSQTVRQQYARVLRHFATTRGVEVCALQAPPLLGAHLGGLGLEDGNVSRLGLLLLGSTLLTAHVFLFNDWADFSRDAHDLRRASLGTNGYGISRDQIARVAIVLLILAYVAFAALGTSAVLFGTAIASLSVCCIRFRRVSARARRSRRRSTT